MSEKAPQQSVPRPIGVILRNRQALAEKIGPERAVYTPAAGSHYWGNYLWDGVAAAVIEAHYGYTRLGTTETFSLLKGQREDGMLRNMQPPAGNGRLHDPEAYTFMDPRKGSDYSQPPILATGVDAVYHAIQKENPLEAKIYLDESYPGLKQSLRYFEKYRQLAPNNPLIFNIHPHETGRDSDEILNQGTRPKLPRQGSETPWAIDIANAGLDYIGAIALSARNRMNGWDPELIRRYYEAVDPMFNSLYVSNMRIAANLADELTKSKDAEHFRDLADEVEYRILTDMWFPQARQGAGAVLALGKKGPVEDISISNLGIVHLQNLSEQQLESVLTMMQRSFNTKFPLPSVATDSPHYDTAGRQPHRVWDGETMIIGNWIEVEGLRMQARRRNLTHRPDLIAGCRYWANDRIAPSSKALVEQGYYEGYDSETGQPRRIGTVHDFTWDGLAEIM